MSFLSWSFGVGGVIEQFFQRDILLQNEITYAQALQEVVGILMYGIASEGENERGA